MTPSLSIVKHLETTVNKHNPKLCTSTQVTESNGPEEVFARLSHHCTCLTCANAAVTLPMVSAVWPIEARSGAEEDESAVNRRDKACKDVCKARDDSSKMVSGEAARIGDVDDCGSCSNS